MSKGKKPTKIRKPSKSSQAKVSQTMDVALSRAKEKLEGMGYDSKLRIHENRDGTVDAELAITVPTRKVAAAKDVLIDSDEALKGIHKELNKGTWISVGLTYSFKDEKKLYNRYRGMQMVGSNYRRATARPKIVHATATARRIDANVQKRKRSRAWSVFVRLHWNVFDKQPKR